ncbi:hypothetical protein ACEPAI_60 [Sanghuangporus weigelae]
MTSPPAPSLPEDQLLELLVQLQKTTPDQARAILNAQPAIGYALVPLMARMGILNLEVLQARFLFFSFFSTSVLTIVFVFKTLATYAGQAVPNTAAQVPAPVPPPVPMIPAHITQVPPYGHQPTPPPPSVPNAYSAQPNQSGTSAPSGYPGYPPPQAPQAQAQTQNGTAAAGSGSAAYPTQYGGQYQQQQQQQQSAPPGLGAFGNIPDDQREMIMRVIAMTPEQIRSLPPQERAITLQLRATLGLPAE